MSRDPQLIIGRLHTLTHPTTMRRAMHTHGAGHGHVHVHVVSDRKVGHSLSFLPNSAMQHATRAVRGQTAWSFTVSLGQCMLQKKQKRYLPLFAKQRKPSRHNVFHRSWSSITTVLLYVEKPLLVTPSLATSPSSPSATSSPEKENRT